MSDDFAAPNSLSKAAPKRKLLLWSSGFIVAIVVWNAVVFIPVSRALSDDEGATIVAYRRWLVSPNEIVIDIWSVKNTQSMAGMDRHLFKTAEALQNRSYSNVVLAYKGSGKLMMDGSYLQEIGATHQTQNPVYTMRTMQEHLTNLDGTPAFGTWTGGWLGVLGKQLEDHNEFHKRWWVRGALGLSDAEGAK